MVKETHLIYRHVSYDMGSNLKGFRYIVKRLYNYLDLIIAEIWCCSVTINNLLTILTLIFVVLKLGV